LALSYSLSSRITTSSSGLFWLRINSEITNPLTFGELFGWGIDRSQGHTHPGQYNTEQHGHTSCFEWNSNPWIPGFEYFKTARILDRATTVIGLLAYLQVSWIWSFNPFRIRTNFWKYESFQTFW